MESFLSSLKTERIARKTYRTRDQAKADVFDYIECFYNPKRRHPTIGYLSPVEFEMRVGFAQAGVNTTGHRPRGIIDLRGIGTRPPGQPEMATAVFMSAIGLSVSFYPPAKQVVFQ